MESDGILSEVGNPGALTFCVILATLMQALDSTIANVALPYMQGSLAVSQDQISWVLTSYIAVAAIMTPPAGYLTARFGLKQVFLVSIVGFTVASMLCGVAGSLTQIVIFRMLQGAFGAALVPLAQSVLVSIYPRERHGFAMALFGFGIMIGPVLGPVLGGWLTESYSWRYVFYINLPLGVVCFLGMTAFLPNSKPTSGARLDWFGFGTLSVAIGALQVFLDRGETKDWFGSWEIVVAAMVVCAALYLFLVHTFTTRRPFVKPSLFRDRNFTAGVIFIAILGLTYYASMFLQPPFFQGLMNYPVLTTGLVMGPRGIGSMLAMLIVGRLIGKLNTRVLLAMGLAMLGWSFYAMTGWTPKVSVSEVVFVTVIQGIGLGFLFVPLSAIALSTLPADDRTSGAGVFNLSRNIGSSVGISVVSALITRNTQINHAHLTQYVTAAHRTLGDSRVAHYLDPLSAGGRAVLNALITQQAQIIAYIDDYKLLLLATLAAVPLLLMFKRSSTVSPEHITVGD
jgi:DHA2 family multidrug resistance protein